MKPAEIQIQLYQGSTFEKEFEWKTREYDDQGNVISEEPVNLNGYTARMQVRKTKKDPVVILELNTENNRIQIVDAANGKFKLFIDAVITEALSFTTAFYDLEFVQGTYVHRLMEGVVLLSTEVTRT